jgi:hypothetical protein
MKPILFALVAFIAVSAMGANDRAPPEQLEKWLTYYYLDPHPDEVPAALRAIAQQGLFENDHVQAPLSGFFAEVFRSNPEKLDTWIKPYLGIPDRHIIYSALWMANSAQSKAALESLAKAAKPDEAKRLRQRLSTPPPTIGAMPIDNPASLDYLWGSFMASGAETPVVRVIEQVKRADVRGNINETLIGSAAKWSLLANASQHAKVLEIIRANAESSDTETRAALGEILSEVDKRPATK